MQKSFLVSWCWAMIGSMGIIAGSAVHAGADEKFLAEKVIAAQSAAKQRQLWADPEWLNLVHYKRLDGKTLSPVDDARFFNASDGKHNPESELLATLAALYADPASGDAHPQCRFPARRGWLQRQLDGALSDLPTVQCGLYDGWRSGIPDQQLTLVFPAYHLNSPSSMFGHTLLRLDPADLDQGSDWLSIAVNFGADVRSDDNSIFYAFKGLTGGYPGMFIVAPYFKKIREYNQDENRDIWEYRLNLRPAEIQVMVTHLWELKEVQFDYYFFDENCSYRLLELIEVARPGIDLTSDFGMTVIPVDTVRAIERAGLIDAVAYRPSQITVLEGLLASIPEAQHFWVKTLAADPDRVRDEDFQALDSPRQRALVDAAYRYLRYQNGRDEREAGIARRSYQLLAQLNSYAVVPIKTFQNAHQPEAGHGSRRLSAALGQRENVGFVDLAYRMSFHSLDDNLSGFLPGAQINLGNLEVRAYERQSPRLQRLDVVDIFSLTPRSALFSPWSWRIKAGLERQPTLGREVLVGHVNGGGGVAYGWADKGLSYALASLRLERNSNFNHMIEPALGGVVGALYHFKSGTAHLELSADRFANEVSRRRLTYRHSVVLETKHALKLQLVRQSEDGRYQSEASLAYQYYFW